MYKTESYSGFALPAWIPQVIKFSFVGILNTVLDVGIYLMLTHWLGFDTFPVLAKGIAYSIGMVNSFILNRTWTFNSNIKVGRAAGIFTLAQITALGVNAGIMALGLNLLQLPELVALGLATLAVFLWNFVINKWIVFRG
jgi:putative flippase GtrA